MNLLPQDDWITQWDRRVLAWLWRPARPTAGLGLWAHLALQVLYLATRGAYLNRLPFQANALTFITLLGLVPALAISFAVAKGFGFAEALQKLLIENEFMASQADIFRQIITYVERTEVRTLGVVGLAVLLLTLLWTISSVEETFNQVWEAPGQRSLLRRFTDYLSILVICPLLVLASTALWAGFSSHAVVRWLLDLPAVGQVAETGLNLGPFLLLTAAFVFIYLFLPNTRVPVWSALLAGVVAAGLWWAMQSLYIYFQVGVARYNAIYGGFASLPLFFVWMQVSWMVLLFGNELARAHHVCRHGPLPRAVGEPLDPAQRQVLGTRLMLRVARSFYAGRRPPTVVDLARETGQPVRAVAETLAALIAAGLLHPPDAEQRLFPARSLATIRLADVTVALRGVVREPDPASADPGEARALALLGQADQASLEPLGRVSLLSLVENGDASRPDHANSHPNPQAESST
ncbi:MAG: YihY/virulence factor BrkB family protein [Desulfarculus sp.]|nr:YihY/virulence factor BrkB family protein [Desulfarculus sp.]